MKTSLDQQETDILRAVLAQLKIKKRTGELGVSHGANRFVSTNLSLRKSELQLIDKIATKVGIVGGLDRVDS
ncbi:MAG: hypothetical protein HEP71_06095 [Roseivirga sp.]|nr:hypothetical protein [Roseivirga sp.]